MHAAPAVSRAPSLTSRVDVLRIGRPVRHIRPIRPVCDMTSHVYVLCVGRPVRDVTSPVYVFRIGRPVCDVTSPVYVFRIGRPVCDVTSPVYVFRIGRPVCDVTSPSTFSALDVLSVTCRESTALGWSIVGVLTPTTSVCQTQQRLNMFALQLKNRDASGRL